MSMPRVCKQPGGQIQSIGEFQQHNNTFRYAEGYQYVSTCNIQPYRSPEEHEGSTVYSFSLQHDYLPDHNQQKMSVL